MSEKQELAKRQDSHLQLTDTLRAVVEKGVTSENVAAVAQFMSLYERMADKQAEREFAEAFVALQSETPKINAMRAVPNRDGTARYRFAPYEDIMREVSPLLQRFGFTVTFSTETDEKKLTKICTLQHVGGHSKSNRFTVRIGSGPPNATEAQADGAASTYAKRFALCDALNIVCSADTDAAVEGAAITAAQVEELAERVNLTNSNRAAFLKFAGAASFEEIPAAKYSILDEFLRKKEQRGK